MHMLNLTDVAVNACFDLLNGLQPKTETTVRLHGKVVKFLRRDCIRKDTVLSNGIPVERELSRNGTLFLEEEQFKYLSKSLDTKIDAGVSGPAAEGYSDLMDAVEHCKEAARASVKPE